VRVLEATAAGALVERPRIVFGVGVLDDNKSDDMRRIVVVDDVVDLDNNVIMIDYSCCCCCCCYGDFSIQRLTTTTKKDVNYKDFHKTER
jgi:hypothetical protein